MKGPNRSSITSAMPLTERASVYGNHTAGGVKSALPWYDFFGSGRAEGCPKNWPDRKWLSLQAAVHCPWLSVTKISLSEPNVPMPFGSRKPLAIPSILPSAMCRIPQPMNFMSQRPLCPALARTKCPSESSTGP